MGNIDDIIQNASKDELVDMFRKISIKMDEDYRNRLNPLFEEVKNFFEQGNYFMHTSISDKYQSLLFITEVEVTYPEDRNCIIISFEEGYRVTNSISRNSIQLAGVSHEIEIDGKDRKFEGWSNIDDYQFASSKSFLDDVSKKVKKWVETKTL